MKIFNFYQTIDDAKITNNCISFLNDIVNIKIEKKFYYLSDGAKIYLVDERVYGIDDDVTIKLKDENYDWDEKKVNMELKIEFQNSKYLFMNNCMVYEDAIIGVGLEWKPSKSRIKKCEKIGEISMQSNNVQFIKEIEMLDLSSDVNLSLKLYIAKPGNETEFNSLANDMGLIIGGFKFLSIKVEGDASVFPVREISSKTAPLWMIECTYSDIYYDSFDDENVKIIINKSHKSYEYIQELHRNYNALFLSEVMSSAVATLIAQIINTENGSIDFTKSYEEGSIVQALKYFKDVLKFDLDGNYYSLYASIKNYFDKEF